MPVKSITTSHQETGLIGFPVSGTVSRSGRQRFAGKDAGAGGAGSSPARAGPGAPHGPRRGPPRGHGTMTSCRCGAMTRSPSAARSRASSAARSSGHEAREDLLRIVPRLRAAFGLDATAEGLQLLSRGELQPLEGDQVLGSPPALLTGVSSGGGWLRSL